MATTVRVKVGSVGIQPSATSGVTLKNTLSARTRLDELLDVDLSLQADNSVPVYNSETDKYEVKPINQSIKSLDGGTF